VSTLTGNLISILNHVTTSKLKRICFSTVQCESLAAKRKTLGNILAAIPHTVEDLKYSVPMRISAVPIETRFANSFVRLDLRRFHISDDGLNMILSNSTHSLEHLSLHGRMLENPRRIGLATVLRKCARLRSLAFNFPEFPHGGSDITWPLELKKMFQAGACPDLREFDTDFDKYKNLDWLPSLETLEKLQIAASKDFSIDHWLSFLEEQRGHALALREISFIIKHDKLWTERDKRRLKEAFERRGILIDYHVRV
jgi:hypothetical protein